jgi:cellulase
MISSTLLLAVTATLLDSVTAHGFVKTVTVNSKITNGSDPVWFYYPAATRPVTAGWDSLNQDNGFVEPASFGTADVACHKSATAGKAYVSANAGDTVQFNWNTWPESHKGPIINYIAPCNGGLPITFSPLFTQLESSLVGLQDVY